MTKGITYESLVEYLDKEEKFFKVIRDLKVNTSVLFADLSGSTEYKQKKALTSGYLKTFRHNSKIKKIAEKYQGKRIKEIGDEVMCRFDHQDSKQSVKNAISCAIELLREFAEENKAQERDEKCFSKIAIHFTSSALEYGESDLIGPCIDIAARVASEVKPEQILITEDAYKVISVRPKLKKQSEICFSDSKQLHGLKGLDNREIVVREVIWDKLKRRIGSPLTTQILTIISVEKAKHARDVFSGLIGKKIQGDFLIGGGIIYGERDIFVRLQARNLSDYKTKLLELQTNVENIRMTYSHFIFPDSLFVNKESPNSSYNTIALILFRATSEDYASEGIFKLIKGLASSGHKEQYYIFECGVLFGEYEAYALIGTRSQEILADLITTKIQNNVKNVAATITNIVMVHSDSDRSKKKMFHWDRDVIYYIGDREI